MVIAWEFFEEFSEYVYVVQEEDHQVVYLNARLRKLLGVEEPGQYLGRRCYELFQGNQAPCPMCGQDTDGQGQFFEWTLPHANRGKCFFVKSTCLMRDGVAYRLGVAQDVEEIFSSLSSGELSTRDVVIRDCVQMVYSSSDAVRAIDDLIGYVGRMFSGTRTYIFERNQNGNYDVTYEWCAPEVPSRLEQLQNEPPQSLSHWLEQFQRGKIILIPDLEAIRTAEPEIYALLKPRKLTALAAGPIWADHDLVGFFSIENPDPRMGAGLIALMQVIGYFLHSLFKRRDLVQQMNRLSRYDPKTGALNRKALCEFYSYAMGLSTVGVLYCDISGLAEINRSLGREAGEDLVVRSYELIRSALETDLIYRMSEEEFVVLMPDVGLEEFARKVDNLRRWMEQTQHYISIGTAWSDAQPISLQSLVTQADEEMCRQKRSHLAAGAGEEQERSPSEKEELSRFIQNHYYDAEALFHSLFRSGSTSYLYSGDLRNNTYYISDNLRDTFGFSSNLVPDLPTAWEKLILSPEDVVAFRQDMEALFRHEKTTHDMRYQVRDKYGNAIWIHCTGVVRWNRDATQPLAFFGSITRQDEYFVVDATTNFPQEYAALAKLNELMHQHREFSIIVFSLNRFDEVNQVWGRHAGNVLLQKLTQRLSSQFARRLLFYRLEGLRFMAVVLPNGHESVEALIQQLQDVIHQKYRHGDIDVRNPCSFGVLHYPIDCDSPQMLLEHAISLLEAAKNNPEQKYMVLSMEDVERRRRILGMSARLKVDVANNMANFRTVVQPQVHARTGKVVGGELLLRWHLDGQPVLTAEMIPLLEQTRLMEQVGMWVFDQAVQTAQRAISYDREFVLSFNVSYTQILDDRFLRHMEQTLQRYQLEGRHLVAELTETHEIEAPHLLEAFVEGCTRLGIRLALDDYGVGYSALGLLMRYPAHTIKLDKSLVNEIADSQQKTRFLSTVVSACHDFGKKVCAEGVETREDWELVQSVGCDLVQGHYFYRPMEKPDLYALLSRVPV